MLIDSFNLGLLRVFESVYRTRSMTRASKELFMTQSGVSQNIKNLEEVLQIKLFDRIKQKLVPTHESEVLYLATHQGLEAIELALKQVTGEVEELTGTVSIGLPIEFGNNIVLPLLAKFGQDHPGVDFKIRYDYASKMNSDLLSGELDFAFVDEFGLDPQIKTMQVTQETLVLCCSLDYLKTAPKPSHDVAFYEQLEYVDYVEGAHVLRSWFKHHLKKSNLDIRTRASLMDVQGMARMIVESMGVGVLPLHVVERLKEQGAKLHQFKGTARPLLNHISVAFIEGRGMSPAAAEAKDYVVNALKV